VLDARIVIYFLPLALLGAIFFVTFLTAFLGAAFFVLAWAQLSWPGPS